MCPRGADRAIQHHKSVVDHEGDHQQERDAMENVESGRPVSALGHRPVSPGLAKRAPVGVRGQTRPARLPSPDQ